MESDGALRSAWRRGRGIAWLALWIAWLWLAGTPWRELGGLIDERTRWLGRFVVGPGLALGALGGWYGRQGLRAGRPWPRQARRLAWPLLGGLALALAVATALGENVVGIVLSAGSALVAGADVSFRVWPQLHGRRPSEPDPAPGEEPWRRSREPR